MDSGDQGSLFFSTHWWLFLFLVLLSLIKSWIIRDNSLTTSNLNWFTSLVSHLMSKGSPRVWVVRGWIFATHSDFSNNIVSSCDLQVKISKKHHLISWISIMSDMMTSFSPHLVLWSRTIIVTISLLFIL